MGLEPRFVVDVGPNLELFQVRAKEARGVEDIDAISCDSRDRESAEFERLIAEALGIFETEHDVMTSEITRG